MKRFFYKPVSLILVVAMLLSLVAVAEDGSGAADISAAVEIVDDTSSSSADNELTISDGTAAPGEESTGEPFEEADLSADLTLEGIDLDEMQTDEVTEANAAIPKALTLGVKETFVRMLPHYCV